MTLSLLSTASGLLLVVFAFLTVGPLHLGAVRLAGVNLLWWYGGVVAPLGIAVLTIALRR